MDLILGGKIVEQSYKGSSYQRHRQISVKAEESLVVTELAVHRGGPEAWVPETQEMLVGGHGAWPSSSHRKGAPGKLASHIGELWVCLRVPHSVNK